MKHVIENFKPQSGYHSVSNSLKQIFSYYGHDFEEEMLFGLASALNFYYFEFNFSKIPFLGGRNKIGDFEENLAQMLNIKIKRHETTSKKRGFSEMLKMIQDGKGEHMEPRVWAPFVVIGEPTRQLGAR